MTTREQIINEVKSFVLAPTFYVYILGIIIYTAAVFLPKTAGIDLALSDTADSAGFALARYYHSGLGALMLFLPAFPVATSVVRDKEAKARNLRVPRAGLNAPYAVLIRFSVQVILLFIPVLLASVYMFSADLSTPGAFRYLLLAFTWILPALIFETAFVQALTEWTGYALPGIIGALVLWVFTQGSTADTGDFLTCIAIRHEALGELAAYASHGTAFLLNRLIVLLLSAGLFAAAVSGYRFHRKDAKKV